MTKITWEGSETFLHGVRVVGPSAADRPRRPRPSTSTPYQPVQEHNECDMSIPRQPLVRPVCLEIPDTPLHHIGQEGRQGYRPAAPIQRFNNTSLNWPSWFRHFRVVADVHGWDKSQRALQLVSYLDEAAMNVAQELGNDELYDYDILVKLLSDRFDPASRVSASQSRFHGRLRRHHEDADSFADAIMDICHVGYPQSSPELRQELISEQFAWGQSDPELKKYLWVVIRTQKDQKMQTLIEVCTDFASLSPSVNIHRPAEQAFAMEEDNESEEMFAMMDRSQWSGQGVSEPALPPSLSQMFARRMGYEMRPITRWANHLLGSPRTSFASRHYLSGKDVTSPKSSVSAAVRWDIRKLVAQSRIRHYRSSHRVGTCSRIINNSEHQFPTRKRHLARDLTQTGLNAIHQDFTASSSTDSARKTSPSDLYHSTTIHTADSVTENAVRFLDHDTTGLTGASIVRTTDSSAISGRRDDGRVETTQTGPPLNHPETGHDDHVDDAVLQISGAGHSGVPRGLGIVGDSYVRLSILDFGLCWSTGGSVGMYFKDTARCQWNWYRGVRMFSLRGVIHGNANGFSRTNL